MLMTADIQKAVGDLSVPEREVVVVNQGNVDQAVKAIDNAPVVACDIETMGTPITLASIGFAVSKSKAYVFGTGFLSVGCGMLTNPHQRYVWQNGQFDLHFLKTRNGTTVAGQLEDTIIQWHTLWPELAGQHASSGGRTYKSLHFLASLYTNDRWWKDYDFPDAHARYVLNGQDCCITYDIWDQLRQEIAEADLQQVYRMTMSRVRPVVDIQAAGMEVDNKLRRKRIRELDRRRGELREELLELVTGPLTERRDRLKSAEGLIFKTRTCPNCRNGSKTKEHNWKQEGFEKAPSKKDLLKLARRQAVKRHGKDRSTFMAAVLDANKAELEHLLLRPCDECKGEGQWTELEFNPASSEQKAALLFNVLRLPRRASVDEETLKGLLGVAQEAMADVDS
jgi:hypothetical protein